MIELSLKTDFLRMERALMRVAEEQMPFAVSKSLNEVARAARDHVNRDMADIFDRPTPFTSRAVVAPRELAATKEHLAAVVTVRPIQAQYLLHEEIGGTRLPSENLRKPAGAIVLPGAGLALDQFGNIPNRTLATLRRESATDARARRRKAAAVKRAKPDGPPLASVPQAGTVVFLAKDMPGNKGRIGGYFRRLAGHLLTRLTGFEGETHYTPRFHYQHRVHAVVAREWVPTLLRNLHEAVRTAR